MVIKAWKQNNKIDQKKVAIKYSFFAFLFPPRIAVKWVQGHRDSRELDHILLRWLF